MRSTVRIGVTSAAVPVKNTSSAIYNNSRGMIVSTSGMPSSRANWSTESRVIPGSTEAPNGGVLRHDGKADLGGQSGNPRNGDQLVHARPRDESSDDEIRL